MLPSLFISFGFPGSGGNQDALAGPYQGVLVVLPFLLNPFAGFAGQSEFTELSAGAAIRRLSNWPDGVATSDVETVSYKSAYSRDSYSSWYRIKLADDAASTWINQIHSHQEEWSKRCLHDLHEGLEGVHRTIEGPPPQHSQTGETPSWWWPPTINFRATEVMLWYKDYDSGVGRATYTAFNTSDRTLWMYDYACQHNTLWTQGNVPSGSVFTTLEE